jgi:prolyl-tRNA synthetase
MLLSNYFLPILKENPKEASISSHQLMLRAGLIKQSVSGIYTYLPYGLAIIKNITNIIIDELNKSGAIELLMPIIQSSDLWIKSNRYNDYGDEMLRIKDRHNKDLLFSPTNEELITKIVAESITSYKDLPLNLYQIHWKFRDEIRPRFGVMRGREFLMKDSYSFDLTKKEAILTYKKMFACYLKIFNRLGLTSLPMKASSGPIGGDFSHEFIILANTGESEVRCHKDLLTLNIIEKEINYQNDIEDIFTKYTSFYSATEDKYQETEEEYNQVKKDVITKRGIEIGHIFYFGDKYSKALDFTVTNHINEKTYPLMGSYGIGVSRLVAAFIEANHDENGIIFNKTISPFTIIVNPLSKDEEIQDLSNKLYLDLLKSNIKVILNDKNASASTKLALADLIGIPYQINIGNNSLKKGIFEVKDRKTNKITEIPINYTVTQILSILND